MKLSSRILLALLAVFILAGASLYFISNRLINDHFLTIEQNEVGQDSARSVNTLKSRTDQLQLKALDWSDWTDTYVYVKDHNTAYRDANIQITSAQNLEVNFMLFYDIQGRLVGGIGRDSRTNRKIAIPQDLLNQLDPRSKLIKDGSNHPVSGVIGTQAGPLIVSALPILTTLGVGPSHGTLIFGEYLDQDVIKQLAELTQLNLGYYQLGGSNLPSDVSGAIKVTGVDTATVVPLNANLVAGYRLINDVNGDPLLIVRTESSRDVVRQGQRAFYYDVGIIMLVVLAAMLGTLFISNRLTKKDRIIQLKNEFFAIANHELRSPMTVIRENSSLAIDTYQNKIDGKLQLMLKNINGSSIKLIRIVNNFLDAAMLEEGEITMHPEKTTLRPLVAEVVDEIQILAKQKKLSLEVSYYGELPLMNVDKDRVREIVYNVISNAIKYTDQGGIVVSVKPQDKGVAVYISDTGRGMTQQQKQVLFKKFTSGEVGGVGLGLNIAKTLTAKMGGRLELVSSELGSGTTFMIYLPAAGSLHTDH